MNTEVKEPKKKKEVENKPITVDWNAVDTAKGKRYIAVGVPKSLSDAIVKMNRVVAPQVLKDFQDGNQKKIKTYLPQLEAAIRRGWNMDKNSKIVRYFNKNKVFDVTVMVRTIIQGWSEVVYVDKSNG